MNQRNTTKVKEKISKIQSNNFEIDDVEILLINIREFARQNGYDLLLEFCDFVAHPDRKKGIIYEQFDISYSKFKYMPTKKGDQLDYNCMNKVVFDLLFIKGVDQLEDEFLIKNCGKNSEQLKNHITTNLVEKSGSVYKIKNETTKNELKEIQHLTNQITQKHILTENSLFNEIKTCVSELSKSIDFQYDEISFTKSKNNLTFCFLEIIQRCNIELHDGQKGVGFITVGSNNTKYANNPIAENLNLSFSVQIPIQQSFAIYELIPTWIFLGDIDSNPFPLVEWRNTERTYGTLKPFTLGKLKQ